MSQARFQNLQDAIRVTICVTNEWTDPATGLACFTTIGSWGQLNGYVGVSEGHPWFGVDRETSLCGRDGCHIHTPSALIDVHGGLTFSDTWAGQAEIERDDRWYFGFDTGHLSEGDFSPLMRDVPGMPEGVVRDQAYVEAECARLAQQLSGVQPWSGEHTHP